MSIILASCSFVSSHAQIDDHSVKEASTFYQFADHMNADELAAHLMDLFFEKQIFHDCRSNLSVDILKSLLDSPHLDEAIASAMSKSKKAENEEINSFFYMGTAPVVAYVLFATLFYLGSRRSGVISTILGAISTIPLTGALVMSADLYNHVTFFLSHDEPFKSETEVIQCLEKLLKGAEELEIIATSHAA